MLVHVVTLVAAFILVKGEAVGTCPDLVGFPKQGGGDVTSLRDTGGNWANLMTDNVFPCSGLVNSWIYYRNDPTDDAFVSVWRIVNDGVFKLIFKTKLPADTVGKHVITLDTKQPVEKGDFIGVHFSKNARKCGIANTNLLKGEDPELTLEDYYFTINVGYYNEDFIDGAEFNFAPNNQMNLVKRVYALQAGFEGDDETASQDLIFDDAKCEDLPAVPIHARIEELPQSGDNWANLQVGDIFPCDGVVTGYEYYRHPGSKDTAYVGIWEYTGPGKYEYTLKHKTALPWEESQGTSGGRVVVSLDPEAYLKVSQLNVLSVFYSNESGGVISNANPWQAATWNIPYTTMYDTLNIKAYNEDFNVGGSYNWDQRSLWIVPRLYALKALFGRSPPPFGTPQLGDDAGAGDDPLIPQCGADVVAVIDNSYSVNREVLQNVTTFFANLVNQFIVGAGATETQFAAVVYDKTVKLQFDLHTNNTRDGVLDNIAGLNLELDGRKTRTDKALQKVADDIFLQLGDRPNNKNIVLIATDGVTHPKRFKPKAVALARKLEQPPYNADVFCVGLPHKKKKDPGDHWNDLASNPDSEHLFLPSLNNLTDLEFAKSVASKIAFAACNQK